MGRKNDTPKVKKAVAKPPAKGRTLDELLAGLAAERERISQRCDELTVLIGDLTPEVLAAQGARAAAVLVRDQGSLSRQQADAEVRRAEAELQAVSRRLFGAQAELVDLRDNAVRSAGAEQALRRMKESPATAKTDEK